MWAQDNTVSIPDMKVGKGKTVSMPVAVSNSTDIVAVQFTLTVPDGISIDTSSATLSERCPGHAISMKEVSSHKYLTMIYSPSNTPISGSDGTIMTVDLSASPSLEEESVHPMTLSDVVLAQRNGDNMVTGFSAGSVTIESSPDFEVSDVSADPSSLTPGSQLTVNWKVSNVGPRDATDGWNTEIFLEKDGISKLVYSVWNGESLPVNASIGCNATFIIPDILGLDGDSRVKVQVTSADEKVGLQGNNYAYANSNVNIARRLYLNYPALLIVEEEARTYMYKLSRSGDTSSAQTFAIAIAPEDSRLALDSEVTVPQGESEVYFPVKVTANKVLDDNTTANLTVSGNGYSSVSSVITIEDDILPDVEMAFDREKVVEGEEFTLTVTAHRSVTVDTPVSISCDTPARFVIPSGIVIPAGQQSVSVLISTKDDNQPDLDHEVGFSVLIDKHNPTTDYILLADNDMPTLTLQLNPDALAEDAGPLAVTAIIKRTDNIDKKITIQFKDNSNGQIYYGRQSFEMAAGVDEAVVNLGPIDNDLVDGERTYNITAAVYIASCSCAASDMASGGVVTVPLTVFDNDGPALNITSASTVMPEGGEISMEVSRNTSSELPLTVSIESDYADRLDYPASVVIPAGESKVSFVVKSLPNDVTDDGFNVVFTVSADGYAKSTTWLTVTDQTLPDARIASIAASESRVFADEQIEVEIVIANDGTYDLPAGVPVNVYANNTSNLVGSVYSNQSVAPGATLSLTCPVVIKGIVGDNDIFAIVNENKSVKELVYTNNSSNVIKVATVSPFGITLSTDKAIYQPQEKVSISGVLSGKRIANEDIEVYVINDGYRKAIAAKSDANGNFSCEYTPFDGQTGHFVIGACYPGENSRAELASMDIYGFKRTESVAISFDVVLGQYYIGSFDIINTGILDQNNVTATVIDKPEGCDVKILGVVSNDNGKTYTVKYEVSSDRLSSGENYEKFRIQVSSDEGGSLVSDIYFYCVTEESVLTANIDRINTTVTKGTPREFPFTIMNTGKGETGKITFSLPDWITPATPKEMASLKQNESADVVLRISAKDNFPLNGAITGQISINCESGRNIVMPFQITPVSEATGTLTVDVCDENSYYSTSAPHVSGAKVKVTNPYTGALVAEGLTGEDGLYSVVLNEGYYSLEVSADGHSDSYSARILVDPGVVTSRVVNLSVKGIDVDWTVERTEIEDEYEITTTVKYEVNVPVPVVELIVPDNLGIENLREGESLVFNAVLVNHGLITAEDVDLILPSNFVNYKFEKLSHFEAFNLAARQSVQIPVKVTRLGVTEVSVKDPCLAYFGTIYYWDCGLDRKWHNYYISIQVGPCPNVEIVSSGGGGGYGGGISGPGTRPSAGSSGGYVANIPSGVVDTDKGCEPCQNSFLFKMTSGLVKQIPVISQTLDFVDRINCVSGNADVNSQLRCVLQHIPVLKDLVEWVSLYRLYILPLFDDCVSGSADSNIPSVSDITIDAVLASRLPDGDSVAGYPSYVQEYLNKLSQLINSINAMYEIAAEICGDPSWMHVSEEELSILSAQLMKWDGNPESLAPYKPSNITNAQYEIFAQRIYNTLNGIDSPNVVNTDRVVKCYREITRVIEFSVNSGYGSLPDMFNDETNVVMASLNESRNSVCSSVTFQFSQNMVMTREAFRGTLKVSNGHESLPIENFKLYLTVADEDGKIATSHEFQTAPESLVGFEGPLDLEAGWRLDSKSDGQATVLFIPTKYAALTEPKKYSFGGFISYLDPFTGSEAVRALTPVTLSVSPSPNLDLTYFMQRDVIGDDPLTEVVEASQEAEFSLLINNTGYGDAKNVRMVTQQPKIVDNRKGLAIKLDLLSSQLNGGDKTLALGGSVATDFGDIPAKSTTYAQWWFTSDLLGHFVEYDVKATHVSSYGNPDLSLLGDVTIHELIRSIKVGLNDDNVIGFLTNDLTDANDTPDMLYVSNGDILPVATPAACEIEKISDTECLLSVVADGNGWVYGNVLDPTYGRAQLKSVVRQSDGAVMPERNFWLTDRTLRDGKDPLYEHRIHFADEIAEGSESYILNFDPIPVLKLEVVSIEGVPAEGTVLDKPLESVNVMFNKHIDPETFTSEDITLYTQGQPRNVGLIGISTEDNKTFKLDFSALNDSIINGFNVLTVQTADIVDVDGFKGKDGKQASWVMYFNNLTRLRVDIQPKNGGVISVPGYLPDEVDGSIHYITYGDTADIVAKPATGYDFTAWYIGDEYLSSDTIISRTMVGDLTLIAKFSRKKVNLNVREDLDGGQISGASTGVYLYGDSVKLTAVPDEDFLFKNWIVNGSKVDGDNILDLELTESTDVAAEFVRDLYRQTFSIYEGWNWVSSYLMEPIDAADFNARTYRILGQFSESILDPSLGMTGDVDNFNPGQTYKVQSNLAFLKTVKGHLYDLAQRPIDLHAGWNWISYPYFESRTLEDAIANASDGDFVVSQLGFAEYADGYWQGSIQTLDPGLGYLYKSEADKRLALDFSVQTNPAAIASMRKVAGISHLDEVDIHKNPNTMNMTVALSDADNSLLGSDYIIYAMVGNECKGISVPVGDLFYLTVYGDDPVSVSFVIENRSTGETFISSDSIEFRNDIVGSRKVPYVINVGDANGLNSVSGETHMMKIYTPSGILIDDDADFESIKSLAPGIYIIDGRKVLVK